MTGFLTELMSAEKSGILAMEAVLWKYCVPDPYQLAGIVRELLNQAYDLYSDDCSELYLYLLDKVYGFAKEYLKSEEYHKFYNAITARTGYFGII